MYFVMAVKRILTNHENTHYFGRNFFLLALKYKQCTVYPLLKEYPDLINIPICSAGKAYTLGIKETDNLAFGKGL